MVGKKIPLTQNKFALVDKEDFKWLNQWKWWFSSSGYANTKSLYKGLRTIGMHRLIMDCPSDKEVDHINRDRLDNRKENLRIVTKSQQQFNIGPKKNNTSGIPGVSWSKIRNKWVASIMINRKSISLGRYSSVQGAILARKWGERLYFR